MRYAPPSLTIRRAADFESTTPVATNKSTQVGISAQMAKERVNAMTQAEVNQVAKNIDSLPAAGDLTITTIGWIGIVLAVGLIAWLFNK